MEINRATVDDLPGVEACADEFYGSSQFLKDFDLDRFCKLWKGLIETDCGVIFFLKKEGQWIGAIGGICFQEIYSGQTTALEMFWFIRDGQRGSGIRLYKELEGWARDKGCSEMRMVHLLDSMPEKLEKVYKHFDFKPAEVHYVKELR